MRAIDDGPPEAGDRLAGAHDHDAAAPRRRAIQGERRPRQRRIVARENRQRVALLARGRAEDAPGVGVAGVVGAGLVVVALDGSADQAHAVEADLTRGAGVPIVAVGGGLAGRRAGGAGLGDALAGQAGVQSAGVGGEEALAAEGVAAAVAALDPVAGGRAGQLNRVDPHLHGGELDPLRVRRDDADRAQIEPLCALRIEDMDGLARRDGGPRPDGLAQREADDHARDVAGRDELVGAEHLGRGVQRLEGRGRGARLGDGDLGLVFGRVAGDGQREAGRGRGPAHVERRVGLEHERTGRRARRRAAGGRIAGVVGAQIPVVAVQSDAGQAADQRATGLDTVAGIVVVAVQRQSEIAVPALVAGLEPVARVVVVAHDGHAGLAAVGGMARLEAIARVAVVALGIRPADAASLDRRIAAFGPVAHVAVVAVERVAAEAAERFVADLDAVAGIAVAAGQRLALVAAASDRIAGFDAVARLAVIAVHGVAKVADARVRNADGHAVARVSVFALAVRHTAARGRRTGQTSQQRVAHLLSGAGLAVVAVQRSAFDAPDRRVAAFGAVAQVAVVALEEGAGDAADVGLAGFEPVAGVAVVAGQGRGLHAARRRGADLEAVARVAVVAKQRRAGLAPRDGIAVLDAVADVVVLAQKRRQQGAGPGGQFAPAAAVARVPVVALAGRGAAPGVRDAGHAPALGVVAGLEPVAGLLVVAGQRGPGLAGAVGADLEPVAGQPVVAHQRGAGNAARGVVADLVDDAGVVVLAVERFSLHAARLLVARFESVAGQAVVAVQWRSGNAPDRGIARFDPVAGVVVDAVGHRITLVHRADHAFGGDAVQQLLGNPRDRERPQRQDLELDPAGAGGLAGHDGLGPRVPGDDPLLSVPGEDRDGAGRVLGAGHGQLDRDGLFELEIGRFEGPGGLGAADPAGGKSVHFGVGQLRGRGADDGDGVLAHGPFGRVQPDPVQGAAAAQRGDHDFQALVGDRVRGHIRPGQRRREFDAGSDRHHKRQECQLAGHGKRIPARTPPPSGDSQGSTSTARSGSSPVTSSTIPVVRAAAPRPTSPQPP